jgi:hypothetical protein
MHNNLVPSEVAIARTTLTSLGTATTVAINTNTSILTVKAMFQPVYVRWNTGVTSANYDEVVLPGETMTRKIDQGEYANISLIEETVGAKAFVIQI